MAVVIVGGQPRTDARLIDLLEDAGEEWGPMGVALAAASLTSTESLIRRLLPSGSVVITPEVASQPGVRQLIERMEETVTADNNFFLEQQARVSSQRAASRPDTSLTSNVAEDFLPVDSARDRLDRIDAADREQRLDPQERFEHMGHVREGQSVEAHVSESIDVPLTDEAYVNPEIAAGIEDSMDFVELDKRGDDGDDESVGKTDGSVGQVESEYLDDIQPMNARPPRSFILTYVHGESVRVVAHVHHNYGGMSEFTFYDKDNIGRVVLAIQTVFIGKLQEEYQQEPVIQEVAQAAAEAAEASA